MMRITSNRRVITADHAFDPILAITSHRGSSLVLAGISTSESSIHIA
jgi:hypothetical protein